MNTVLWNAALLLLSLQQVPPTSEKEDPLARGVLAWLRASCNPSRLSIARSLKPQNLDTHTLEPQ